MGQFLNKIVVILWINYNITKVFVFTKFRNKTLKCFFFSFFVLRFWNFRQFNVYFRNILLNYLPVLATSQGKTIVSLATNLNVSERDINMGSGLLIILVEADTGKRKKQI